MRIPPGTGIALWLLTFFIIEITFYRNASIIQKWHFELKPYIVYSDVVVKHKVLKQNQSSI